MKITRSIIIASALIATAAPAAEKKSLPPRPPEVAKQAAKPALPVTVTVTATKVGGPVDGLDKAGMALFLAGKAVFSRVFAPDTGLGPKFNNSSCAACHEVPVV